MIGSLEVRDCPESSSAQNAGILVVGGDSLVGASLATTLRHEGASVVVTTRRQKTLGPQRLYLEYQDSSPFRAPKGIGHAVVLAGITSYSACERDQSSRAINVEAVSELVQSLLKQGLGVTFVSSNTVFGGSRPWPEEGSPHLPTIEYGRQKSEAEAAIKARAKQLGLLDQVQIVRLTKVVDRRVPPLPTWLAAWRRGESAFPFEDFIFSPISLAFACTSLSTIVRSSISGDFHISGSDNVTYAEFAELLALRFGVDRSLLSPLRSGDQGVRLHFQPTYSGLGMSRTARLTNLKPQPLEDVVCDM